MLEYVIPADAASVILDIAPDAVVQPLVPKRKRKCRVCGELLSGHPKNEFGQYTCTASGVKPPKQVKTCAACEKPIKEHTIMQGMYRYCPVKHGPNVDEWRAKHSKK